MWIFTSPKVVFGDDALEHLENLRGRRAFFVTDANMVAFGFVEQVQQRLAVAGLESAVFAEVEPNPSLQTVRRAAQQMAEYQPDWIIGLGGGSAMDAAKAAWLLYECPDADPAAINPMEEYGLRQKARLIAIPTTSGTGSEATWATVLTDTDLQMKLAMGTPELMPDLAIVDSTLVLGLPPRITADTGMDVLTHAVEAYTNTMRNDFTDGMALKAVDLVFKYLPRAYADGADAEARGHMHNAAAIAGLAFGNSMLGLAHAMGHSLGAVLHVPHGRSVGMFLPYVVEFTANGGATRYSDIAHHVRLPAEDEETGTAALVSAIRELSGQISFATSLQALGIERAAFEQALPKLVANAEADNQIFFNARYADSDDLAKLFQYAYDGRSIDF
ncbi:MAG TPA: iron-containing alcohol dehydrogenase [Anaerolineae bacterium]|nr:iron-containing alcohol dehydrogenase [Anaerolineae bacterium]